MKQKIIELLVTVALFTYAFFNSQFDRVSLFIILGTTTYIALHVIVHFLMK